MRPALPAAILKGERQGVPTCRRFSRVHSASHTNDAASSLLPCSSSAVWMARAIAGASRRLRVRL